MVINKIYQESFYNQVLSNSNDSKKNVGQYKYNN